MSWSPDEAEQIGRMEAMLDNIITATNNNGKRLTKLEE